MSIAARVAARSSARSTSPVKHSAFNSGDAKNYPLLRIMTVCFTLLTILPDAITFWSFSTAISTSTYRNNLVQGEKISFADPLPKTLSVKAT